MKKILLFAAFLACVYGASAQVSVGARTGLSCWKSVYLGNSDNKIASKGNEPVWDKQVYVRYETKGRFAFEAGFGHYRMNENYFGYPDRNYTLFYPGELPLVIDYNELNNYTELNLSAQYDVSCPAMKCLKSYIGVTISPTSVHTRTETVTAVNGELRNNSNSFSHMTFFTGLQHYMQYSLTDHIKLNSLAEFKMQPATFFSNQYIPSQYAPNTRFSWQLGVGYQL